MRRLSHRWTEPSPEKQRRPREEEQEEQADEEDEEDDEEEAEEAEEDGEQQREEAQSASLKSRTRPRRSSIRKDSATAQLPSTPVVHHNHTLTSPSMSSPRVTDALLLLKRLRRTADKLRYQLRQQQQLFGSA